MHILRQDCASKRKYGSDPSQIAFGHGGWPRVLRPPFARRGRARQPVRAVVVNQTALIGHRHGQGIARPTIPSAVRRGIFVEPQTKKSASSVGAAYSLRPSRSADCPNPQHVARQTNHRNHPSRLPSCHPLRVGTTRAPQSVSIREIRVNPPSCLFLPTGKRPGRSNPGFWRFSPFFAPFTTSPHELTRAPHRLTRFPPKFTCSPRRLTRFPHPFTSTPGRLTRAPLEFTLTPLRLTCSPHRLTSAPPKLTGSPRQLTPTPDRLPCSPHRQAPAPRFW